MFFFMDDAFKQHREAKPMLLDVSGLVALIDWPFVLSNLLCLTACFPVEWIAGHGGGVLACELQFEECGEGKGIGALFYGMKKVVCPE